MLLLPSFETDEPITDGEPEWRDPKPVKKSILTRVYLAEDPPISKSAELVEW